VSDRIKIEDSRLTPTMKFVRSGSKVMFREYNPGDRSFIRKENCNFTLIPDKKSMYPELIDGEWCWVEGCQECLGLPRNPIKSYIECEEHDVCRSCGIKREDVAKYVYGCMGGWLCPSCHKQEKADERAAAYAKLDGKTPDTSGISDVICPHCGSDLGSDDRYENEEITCETCGGDLQLTVEFDPVYSTSVIGERITE